MARASKKYIPTELVRPHIEAYLADRGISIEEFGGSLGLDESTPRKWLASDLISFKSADLMLCKAEAQGAWREEPLVEYYWEGAEIPPDPSKPVKCKNPDCDNWFALEEIPAGRAQAVRIKAQRYCSRKCSTKEFNKAYRKRHEKRVKDRVNAGLRKRWREDPEYRERKTAYSAARRERIRSNR